MWSGPRNLSTAMMRSFGNRDDVREVMDEPFYGVYLHETGKRHPMREEVLASQPTGWRDVVVECTREVPEGGICYQKHMTHHMLPEIPRDWLGAVSNVFLIRDPRRVVASYGRRMEQVTLEDIGFAQQADLFDRVLQIDGTPPPVVDAEHVRADPEGTLRKLCSRLGLTFDGAMLAWPEGPRDSDGAWAPHWYASVENSTGFSAPEPDPGPMPESMEALARLAMPAYVRLAAFTL